MGQLFVLKESDYMANKNRNFAEPVNSISEYSRGQISIHRVMGSTPLILDESALEIASLHLPPSVF